MKKFIAIALSLALVFAMTGVAFADTNTNADIQKTTVAADKDTLKFPEKAKPASLDKLEVLPIKTLADSTTAKAAYMTWELNPNMYGFAEVTAPVSGYVTFDCQMAGAISADRVDIMVAEDLNSEYFDDWICRLCPGDAFSDENGLYMEKGETFYIYFVTPDYNTGTISVSCRANFYSAESDRTLPTDKYMWSSSLGTEGLSDIYYKVVPNKTGLMTVNLNTYTDKAATGTITLCNANKKALSTEVQYNSSKDVTKAYFGVTKGKTYYIRVQNCYDVDGCSSPKYGIKYGMTVYTDRYLPNNAKAKQLYKGYSATNTLFTANNATGTDTYKIYVPQQKVTKFTVNTKKIRSGNITVKVYKGNKFIGSDVIYANQTGKTFTITYGTSYGKASKGTYYIKLVKGAKVSGLYTIRYTK